MQIAKQKLPLREVGNHFRNLGKHSDSEKLLKNSLAASSKAQGPT